MSSRLKSCKNVLFFYKSFIYAPFSTKLDRQLFHVRILQPLNKIYATYRFSPHLKRNKYSL